MDSHGNRKLKQLIAESKSSPRFYQIILEESLGEGRLLIPESFVSKYGTDLQNEVILKVPTGAVWKVELAVCDDGLWLQKGWREFQEYYSIGYGTFLLFEYTSKSYFHVVICDKSASEIDYPSSAYDDCMESKFEGNYNEALTERNGGNNENMEIMLCLPSSKKRKDLVLSFPRPSKVGRSSTALKSEAKRVNKNVSISKQGKNRFGSNREVSGNDEKTTVFSRAERFSKMQESRTLASIKNLRASKESVGLKDENTSFCAVIKPSHSNRGCMWVPIKFARTHLKKKRGNAIFQISRRKNWTVGFRKSDDKLGRTFFSSGLYAFLRDNNLKAGDVCVFELIDRTKYVLKVVIDRASKEKIIPEPSSSCADKTMETTKSNSSLELNTEVASCIKSENSTEEVHLSGPKLQLEDKCKDKGLSLDKERVSRKNVTKKSLRNDEKAKALSRVRGAFKSENPYFMVVMQPAYTASQLNLPFEFVERHFKGEYGEIVLQVSGGRAWTVDYHMISNLRKARFLSSWAAFVRDNNLAVGDVCIFELIKSTKSVLKVLIFRAGDTQQFFGSMHNSRSNVKEENITVDKLGATFNPDGNSSGKMSLYEEKLGRRLSVIEAAENFTSMYPSFKVFMGSSNLKGKAKVMVPAKFMKFITQGTTKALKLRLCVGENTWPVKLTRIGKIGKLTSGWDIFSGENHLHFGDCCVFELVDSEALKLKVSIFRLNG